MVCPRCQRQTQKNVLKAFFDRNGRVPELSTACDKNVVALRFCEYYVTLCEFLLVHIYVE